MISWTTDRNANSRVYWGTTPIFIAFGVAMVKTYETERDVKMGPNASTEIAGYQFRMTALSEVRPVVQ